MVDAAELAPEMILIFDPDFKGDLFDAQGGPYQEFSRRFQPQPAQILHWGSPGFLTEQMSEPIRGNVLRAR